MSNLHLLKKINTFYQINETQPFYWTDLFPILRTVLTGCREMYFNISPFVHSSDLCVFFSPFVVLLPATKLILFSISISSNFVM